MMTQTMEFPSIFVTTRDESTVTMATGATSETMAERNPVKKSKTTITTVKALLYFFKVTWHDIYNFELP